MADQQIQQGDMAMKRRGLFAAAAAVVAGIVARLAEAPVFASGGSGDQGSLALGSNPWYISGSPSANAPAVASAPTVVQASANFRNFVKGDRLETVTIPPEPTLPPPMEIADPMNESGGRQAETHARELAFKDARMFGGVHARAR